eukprot:CAMPEP_0197072202 /NCGR_PEP_ID=MMETSP1384-20130603/209977_1 /TAXON_ID=29189 /ORGANISM="Ammonia sp." /LENGTH=975 /DNA_ID=CAMNT_0042511019 /DNA_START=25 /DNA_END=2953 /DNA_ORIENTATION=+
MLRLLLLCVLLFDYMLTGNTSEGGSDAISEISDGSEISEKSLADSSQGEIETISASTAADSDVDQDADADADADAAVDTTPTIQITLADDKLQVASTDTSRPLPREYSIGSTLSISTTLAVATRVKVYDIHKKWQPISIVLKPSSSADAFSDEDTDTPSDESKDEFEVHLLHLGDFCFRVVPLTNLLLTFNSAPYCFRVLPSKVLSESNGPRVIVIENANTKSFDEMKREIQKALGIDVTAPKRRLSAASDDHDKRPPPETPRSAADAASFQPSPETPSDEHHEMKREIQKALGIDVTAPKRRLSAAFGDTRTPQETSSDGASTNASDGDSASESQGSAAASSQQSDGESAAPKRRLSAASDDERPPPETPRAAAHEGSSQPPPETPSDGASSKASDGDSASESQGSDATSSQQSDGESATQKSEQQESKEEAHDATMIGINLSFESLGILVEELGTQKLLFLVQHIASVLMTGLDENDVIVTLPTSKKIRPYHTGTVSERVALIVAQARRRRKGLKNCYELQYSSNLKHTFGGKIILNIGERTEDVPAKTLAEMADMMISIGADPQRNGNVDAIGVTVRHSASKKYACLRIIASLKTIGYDQLKEIADTIANCMFHEMGIPVASALKIDIEMANGKVTEKKEPGLIEFEVSSDGSIKLSKDAEQEKLFPDDGKDGKPNGRQIQVLRGNAVTVRFVNNKTDEESTKSMKDVVFYVDVIDAVGPSECELEDHPKLQGLHDLLYSPEETVPIPIGLWSLCVSWTAITTAAEGGNETAEQVHKCSDDLYLNGNWNLTDEQEHVLQEFNADGSAIKDDNSQFLSVLLLHLDSLLSDIYSFRNELSENTEEQDNLLEKLLQHRYESKAYFKQLTKLKELYQITLNEKMRNNVKENYEQSQLVKLERQLAMYQKLEKLYGEKLLSFKASELGGIQKQAETISTQIESSQRQIASLTEALQQQEELLKNLEKQSKSITMTAD